MSQSRDLEPNFGLLQGSLHIRYLGVPLIPHKLRPQDYRALINKVLSKVFTWKVCHLSFTGRLQVIQTIIVSIVSFWCTIFLSLIGLEELERICSTILWSGASNSAKRVKVMLDFVCTSKKTSGLRLKRLVDWNKVFALKLIWLLFTSSGSFWVS